MDPEGGGWASSTTGAPSLHRSGILVAADGTPVVGTRRQTVMDWHPECQGEPQITLRMEHDLGPSRAGFCTEQGCERGEGPATEQGVGEPMDVDAKGPSGGTMFALAPAESVAAIDLDTPPCLSFRIRSFPAVLMWAV